MFNKIPISPFFHLHFPYDHKNSFYEIIFRVERVKSHIHGNDGASLSSAIMQLNKKFLTSCVLSWVCRHAHTQINTNPWPRLFFIFENPNIGENIFPNFLSDFSLYLFIHSAIHKARNENFLCWIKWCTFLGEVSVWCSSSFLFLLLMWLFTKILNYFGIHLELLCG